MMWVFRLGLLLIALFLVPGIGYSQSKLRIRHISVEDGLSQSSVYSIFQDAFGYIWMATGDVLNRYDGKQLISYKSKLSQASLAQLRDRNINSQVMEDRLHNLWFTADEGLYKMDRRTGQTTIVINKSILGYSGSLAGIDSSHVWLAVTNYGVLSVDVRTLSIRKHLFRDSFRKSNPVGTVIRALHDTNRIWILDDSGLLEWDDKAKVEKRVLNLQGGHQLCKLSDFLLAISVEDGIVYFNTQTNTSAFQPLVIPGRAHTSFSAIIPDAETDRLYVASVDGGYICNLSVPKKEYEILHFQDNQVVRMFIDRSRNLWVGTDGGGAYVVDIKPPKFNCYIPKVGAESGAMLKSLFRGSDGVIWMGLYGRGLLRYDPASGQERLFPLVPKPDAIYYNCTFRDSSGDLVVALNDRIVWVDDKSGAKKAECTLPYYTFMGPAPVSAFSITEMSKGSYIVGANHGVFHVQKVGNNIVARYIRKFGEGVLGGWVYGSLKDGPFLYLGKRNGFVKISLEKDTIPVLHLTGLRDVPVRHFYKSTTTDFLWVASEQGLIAFNETTGKFHVFDEESGLANSFIYAILPEDDSVLWVSTNRGISKVNIHYAGPTGVSARFTNFSSRDGLQSNEFNSGAFFHDKDGTMMFGGIAGLNWFHPKLLHPNLYLAKPVLTGIYVDDTLVARDTTMFMSRLVLPYSRNTVSLTFKALEYTLPEQNRYAYKLEGQDNEWVYTTNDKVRFAKLEPGGYTFLLKVTNNDGIWNERPLALEIIINPPYWRTWWFRLLLVVAGASVIAGMLRYYMQQRIRSRMLAMERQYALHMERLRISKDVHDDIGSGLSRISLLSEIASKKMYVDERAARDMRNISSLSKELVDNMRDLIWVLNPENTTLDSLVSRMREYTVDYLDGIGVSLVLAFPDVVPATYISREVQRNIFSTVKEAINNCVKHAHAQTIWLTVGLDNELFSIVVKDDGVGFDMAKPGNGGNGLRNMRFRIESVGGKFSICSEHEKGTTIGIEMPVARLRQHTS